MGLSHEHKPGRSAERGHSTWSGYPPPAPGERFRDPPLGPLRLWRPSGRHKCFYLISPLQDPPCSFPLANPESRNHPHSTPLTFSVPLRPPWLLGNGFPQLECGSTSVLYVTKQWPKQRESQELFVISSRKGTFARQSSWPLRVLRPFKPAKPLRSREIGRLGSAVLAIPSWWCSQIAFSALKAAISSQP